MKFITNFKELNGDSGVSLLDHIAKTPIEGKDKVLSYLRNGKKRGVRCSGVFDYVANDPQLNTIHLFTDGEYFWDSEEVYHFEKYNLSLDAQFIKKALSQ